MAINQLNAVYFVNSDLPELATLLAGVPQGAQVVLLDPTTDGLTQMLAALNGRTGLDAIHIIGHGASGLLTLGSTNVTTQTLTERAADLAALGGALAATGDILLYGCNVAAGADGLSLVNALANATGADVAASTDLTGAAAKGGDWVLEATTEAIESTSISAPSYAGVLANASTNISTTPQTVSFYLWTNISGAGATYSISYLLDAAYASDFGSEANKITRFFVGATDLLPNGSTNQAAGYFDNNGTFT
ncbi:MAG: DUF4347 domain-containing protein, partial [Rhodoferax sp.]